jgi:hypothetical protein
MERGRVRHEPTEKVRQRGARAMKGMVVSGTAVCGEEQAHPL